MFIRIYVSESWFGKTMFSVTFLCVQCKKVYQSFRCLTLLLFNHKFTEIQKAIYSQAYISKHKKGILNPIRFEKRLFKTIIYSSTNFFISLSRRDVPLIPIRTISTGKQKDAHNFRRIYCLTAINNIYTMNAYKAKVRCA